MEDFATGKIFPRRYRNSRLGDFLKELDLTEGYATGIKVVLDVMKFNGSATPIFETDEDRTWFMVKLPMHETFVVDVENDVENRTAVILRSIQLNPKVSKKELMELTGASQATIDREIRRLRKEEFIERVGPDKGGYWKILKEPG